jgi:hypothetical protein
MSWLSLHRSVRVRSSPNVLDLGRLGLGGDQHEKTPAGADTPAQRPATLPSPNSVLIS